MKLGICGTIDHGPLFNDIGYAYIELNIGEIAKKSEIEYQEFNKIVQQSPLKAYAYNCLFPVGFRVIGNDIDKQTNQVHLEKAFSRAKDLGGEIIVFGSGHSRKIPDGFDRNKAEQQLLEFLQLLGQFGEKHGMTVVLEHLPSRATNFINTPREALQFAETLNHPHVRVLIDYWHMCTEKENTDVVFEIGNEYLKHIHIANPNGGIYPFASDPVDYVSFINRLEKIGYDGGMSIEASSSNIREDAQKSFVFLNPLCNG